MSVYKFRKIISDSYKVLLVGAVIGLAAGYLLDSTSDKVAATVLAMVPPINGIGGNIGSILGARLSSALHLGIVKPQLRGQDTLRLNLLASVSLGLIVFGFIGGIFFAFSLLTGGAIAEALRIATIFFTAGMLLTGIIAFTSVISAFVSYTRGIDPDNVVIPVVTTVVDVAGVVSLLIVWSIIGV